MGVTTEITWCDETWNPWWGCQKVSPGCTNCYADTQSRRYGYGTTLPAIWGPPEVTTRRLMGDAYWRLPLTWDRRIANGDVHWRKNWRPAVIGGEAGGARLVFCASMADVFEDNPLVELQRTRLWNLIRQTPNLRWLLLTKRPQNIGQMLPAGYWPNVWLGTSTENQQYAAERIPYLLESRDRVPVLWISAEPQIDRITLVPWLSRLDWIISGFESGPRHRPGNADWLRLTRDECRDYGVPWHFKQWGGRTHAEGGCELDGQETKEFPSTSDFRLAA